MRNDNYYALLKLSPFPKIPGKEEIEAAISKWITETTKKSNSSGTPTDQKKELREMLRVLPPKLKDFSTDTKEQNNQRNQYRDIRCAQLQVIADYMKKYSGNSVREATLKRIARQAGLAPDDVIKVFQTAGFEMLPSAAPTCALPDTKPLTTFSENVDQLQKELARGVGHIPAGIGSVKNLYQYLELMLGYEGMEAISMNDWKAVQANFSELSVKHATGTVPYIFYRNIESMANTSIFSNGINKKKYDSYVILQESGLSDALDSIAGLPESMRTDPIFARNWVSSIQHQLTIDEEEAYGVYNICCKIPPEERLEKEDIQVRTLCSCGHLNTHESLRAAMQAPCAVCGKNLFIPCPSCEKPMRNSADICPSCGYDLPGELIFRQAMQSCQEALDMKQIAEARKQLNRAQDYKLKKVSLTELKNQIVVLEKSIGTALGKIDQLILAGKLSDASRELQALRVFNPTLDVSTQLQNLQEKQQEIASQKKELDLKMLQLVKRTPREQVQICMEIISRDESYEPARQLLRSPSLAPASVTGVKAVKDDATGTITISWDSNPQNTYVTYTLIRLNTNSIPTSPQQGTLLAKDLETTSFQDTGAATSMFLYYAVFVVRKNVEQWSKAAISVIPVVLMPRCKSFNYTVTGSDCVLQWEFPAGCAGVRLERDEGQTGRWELLQSLTNLRTFTDHGLKMNASYEYRCTTVWTINGQKHDSPLNQTIFVTRQNKPSPVSLSVVQQQTDGWCAVSWNTDNQGQMEIWSLPLKSSLKEGTLLEYEELKRSCTRIWQGAAPTRTATFDLGANKQIQLISASAYGSQVVVGKPTLISTMSPLPALWDQMKITDNQLVVPFEDVAELEEVMVFLDLQEEPERNTILNRKAFFSQKYFSVSGSQQVLKVPNLPQSEQWLTIVGILKNGSITRASRYLVNNLPKLAVTYQLNWRRGGVFRSFVTGLEVLVRVLKRNTPHVILVYNKKNPTIPLRENEFAPDHMAILVDLPEGNSSVTRMRAQDSDVQALPQGARVKLMLAPEVHSGYQTPVPEDAMGLTKP